VDLVGIIVVALGVLGGLIGADVGVGIVTGVGIGL
jgi:hypothetical protein